MEGCRRLGHRPSGANSGPLHLTIRSPLWPAGAAGFTCRSPVLPEQEKRLILAISCKLLPASRWICLKNLQSYRPCPRFLLVLAPSRTEVAVVHTDKLTVI